MTGGLKARLAGTALAPVAVIWGFGYLLVDIFAFLMGRTAPGQQFLATLPFLAMGVALTLLLDRVRRRLQRRPRALRWLILAIGLFAAGALQAWLDLVWFRWLAHALAPAWLAWADAVTLQRFISTFILYLWTYCLTLTTVWAAGVGRRAEAAEADADRAESEAARAEATALRLQLNPHFLFNALNSISSLVTLDRKAEAEAMIQSLGEFLRASLHADPMADVTLAEEIETIDAYLAIESVRFGERLAIEIDVAPGLSEARVPNFILQPLVENAVKHGVGATRGNETLTIEAARAKGEIVLGVTNLRAGGSGAEPADTEPRPSTGIGLANIRQRLAIRYGKRAALKTGPVTGGWRAVIRLQEEGR